MTEGPTLPGLDLSIRTSLPDDIAYLRATYPASGWPRHRNFGDLAAFWLDVHAQLRREAASVLATIAALRDRKIDRAAFPATFVSRLNGFLRHLDQHHRIEDAAYFPKFRALDQRMIVGFDLLEADHQSIHDRLETSVDSARTLLAHLAQPGGDFRAALDVHARDAPHWSRCSTGT